MFCAKCHSEGVDDLNRKLEGVVGSLEGLRINMATITSWNADAIEVVIDYAFGDLPEQAIVRGGRDKRKVNPAGKKQLAEKIVASVEMVKWRSKEYSDFLSISYTRVSARQRTALYSGERLTILSVDIR